MATQNVCKWNKFGYCKHGEMCRKFHAKEICENASCQIMCCLKRHPKQCKYYINYKQCKFDPCAFLHVEHTDDSEHLKKENELILSKINDINKSIKELEVKEFETEKFISKLLDIEKKLDTFNEIRQDIHTNDEVIDILTQKVTDLEVSLREKDKIIDELANKVSNLDNVIEKLAGTVEKINALEEGKKGKSEKFLKCSNCSFETNSKHGLKIHMKKKHTAVQINTFPSTCHLCEKSCENSSDLKKHILTHSYKEIKYKCEECDFAGQNEVTMEVHLGKHHSEKYECGMCDFEAGSLENLETHLNTCEVFQCDWNKDKCKKRFKTFTDIKKHFLEEHNKEYGYLEHLKLDRNDINEVTERAYRSDEM